MPGFKPSFLPSMSTRSMKRHGRPNRSIDHLLIPSIISRTMLYGVPSEMLNGKSIHCHCENGRYDTRVRLLNVVGYSLQPGDENDLTSRHPFPHMGTPPSTPLTALARHIADCRRCPLHLQNLHEDLGLLGYHNSINAWNNRKYQDRMRPTDAQLCGLAI